MGFVNDVHVSIASNVTLSVLLYTEALIDSNDSSRDQPNFISPELLTVYTSYTYQCTCKAIKSYAHNSFHSHYKNVNYVHLQAYLLQRQRTCRAHSSGLRAGGSGVHRRAPYI